MESSEYDYFGGTLHQAYHYMGVDVNFGFGEPSSNAVPTSIEPHGFNPESVNRTNHPATPQDGFLAAMPTSYSPQPHQYPWLPGDSISSGCNVDLEESSNRRSSSAERDSLSPAQARRKAQNRAAQRAFRERKERHVRDLEMKVGQLEATVSSLRSDNERFRSMLSLAQSENESFRAKFASPSSAYKSSCPLHRLAKQQSSFQPRITSVTSRRRSATATGQPPIKTPFKNTLGSDDESLPATALWNLFQKHPLYLSGTLDIAKVCERLREIAGHEEMGPVLSRAVVLEAIDEVGRNGNDTNRWAPSLIDGIVLQ